MIPARIGIVEDERIVALHMKQQLERLGYDVVATVASGEKALLTMMALRPDLILMDIHIEGPLDGIETAARLPSEIAIVYLTAYAEEATLGRARATKPYGYLVKPYSERELHATIQMALERRRADILLKTSDERFRSIFNAISEGIFVVDADTYTIVEANEPAALMFGASRAELVGSDITTLSAELDAFAEPQTRKMDHLTIASGIGRRLEWNCRGHDGRTFWTETSIRSATLDGREMLIFIVRDVTDQRKLEAQLRQSQRLEAVGQLTGGVAHDFNNLLTVILGNSEFLSERLATDPMLHDFAQMTLTAAKRGAELTNRLLAFARRQPLDPKPVDVRLLIGNMEGLLRRTLGEHIDIALDFAPDLFEALIDAAQLESALLNLCINARDAMEDGGNLTIEASNAVLDDDYVKNNADAVAGAYVMVTISDTGPGMDALTASQAFEPFFTTKDVGKGSGLGLSMVYGFIKQSKGHVKIYTEIGEGTAVRLYLPRAEGASDEAGSVSYEGADRTGTESILVVEDDELVRAHVAGTLGMLGYRVTTATNGAEGLDILKRGDPCDLLLTDVVMPGGMGGRQLADAARLVRPGLAVLFTSGYTENAIIHNGRLDPGVFLLQKPYQRHELAAKVRFVIDEAKASATRKA